MALHYAVICYLMLKRVNLGRTRWSETSSSTRKGMLFSGCAFTFIMNPRIQ
jgi:hypothetical protein